MPTICKACQRLNPSGARYCYQDGKPLDDRDGAGPAPGVRQFPFPFVFPSGRTCMTFDALIRACREEWDVARALLRQGTFQSFLAQLGRPDLAEAARREAGFPDPDRGLDQLLAVLPGEETPARLRVDPREMNLGVLTPGQDRVFQLRLINSGGRLLYGTVACPDARWLALGEPEGGSEKTFKCLRQHVMAVHVRGDRLRAGFKPLEAQLLISSNGGSETVLVRAEVPVKPFPSGVLKGALTPRQIAEKARAYPQEAAPLFESGKVAEWYRSNQWVYPVQGRAATGLAAVQQLLDALGLGKPAVAEAPSPRPSGAAKAPARPIPIEQAAERKSEADGVILAWWLFLGALLVLALVVAAFVILARTLPHK